MPFHIANMDTHLVAHHTIASKRTVVPESHGHDLHYNCD